MTPAGRYGRSSVRSGSPPSRASWTGAVNGWRYAPHLAHTELAMRDSSPGNDYRPGRVPVFIDDIGQRCAVA